MAKKNALNKETKQKLRLELFDYVVLVVMTIYVLIIFYPFYNTVIASFVGSKTYSLNPAMLFPPELIFDNYKKIFLDSNIISGYINTLLLCFLGVPLSMFFTVTMAYAFSRGNFPGKKFLFILAIFTMFFSGGVVPIYMNIKNLNLMGSILPVMLMYGINTYFMIIIKNSFENLPGSLEEAAKIDGANDLIILVKVMMPLIVPTLVTFALFITVDRWNEWFWSTLLIKDNLKQPLQVVLRKIISQSSSSAKNLGFAYQSANVYADGIKMASVVVTMLPVMLVYPFIQKYFVKGITLGAVKM